MIKLVFCLRRLPHLSREEFQRYWRETHGPLVKRHAPALRIRRYVQTHTLEHELNGLLRETRNGPEPYDGVAELSWDSPEDLVAATESDEGQQASVALFEDEQRFVDHANSPLWINREHFVIGGDGSG
jgi:uncharacterized protein (TIGR02118 family)